MYSPFRGPLWTKRGYLFLTGSLWSIDRVSIWTPIPSYHCCRGAGGGGRTRYDLPTTELCVVVVFLKLQDACTISVAWFETWRTHGDMSKTLWYWGKAIINGRQGWGIFPILNEEPFGTPESSKSKRQEWHPTRRSWKKSQNFTPALKAPSDLSSDWFIPGSSFCVQNVCLYTNQKHYQKAVFFTYLEGSFGMAHTAYVRENSSMLCTGNFWWLKKLFTRHCLDQRCFLFQRRRIYIYISWICSNHPRSKSRESHNQTTMSISFETNIPQLK